MAISLDDSSKSTSHRKTKCVGRFPEIRDYLVETINAIFLPSDADYKVIAKRNLDEIYTLIDQDIPGFDVRDPYMNSSVDTLRTNFANIAGDDISLSIVPLITTDVPVNSTLVMDYARKFGINRSINDVLPFFCKEVDKNPDGAERLDLELKIRMHDILVPDKDDPKKEIPLKEYKLAVGFGIGPNKLVTLAYDAPFHIELHALGPDLRPYSPRTTETGVLGIGFWINENNQMLVGQIQAMRGKRLPQGAQLGTAALKIAEKVGRAMGFDSIVTYSANEHPQFRMHPDSKTQMIGDFKCYHDSSAKTLGWLPINRKNSTNNEYHVGYIRYLNGSSPASGHMKK